ncbi:hypothetical protein HNY73_019416 [Argiope bruennichi]|uniref:Uncharacterized protein n=1 Tax=Argiope bruennichi TaxID=94029 RepID=A0A8T0E3J3_ARGBR|nr:hypothetical protein HNY73_019416 [Argiope bruennichi]
MHTKRYLLQAAGRIFDPVGFPGSFTIRLKFLVQDLWYIALYWDERFPMKLDTDWNEWCDELNTFHIPRYCLGDTHSNEIDNTQMHCFSADSKKAYEAVVIQEIQRFTDPKDWHNCTAQNNPANLISRFGMLAAELRDSDFWCMVLIG